MVASCTTSHDHVSDCNHRGAISELTKLPELAVGNEQRPESLEASCGLLSILLRGGFFTRSIWGLNISRAFEVCCIPDELLDHIAIVLDEDKISRADYYMA